MNEPGHQSGSSSPDRKPKTGRSIMFVGTGSDVGKSVINTAFCRIFLQDGYQPAPFKAQNMSLNSYATPDGLEIGRAQAVQAEACGISCSTEMNPVLLKPTSYMSSQVILNGKPVGNKTAREYFDETDRDLLFGEAMKACHKLRQHYNPIVIEGAGSISEMNLWDRDITNMRVAEALQSPVFLIADIDKGGVFASVYGSIKLLPQNWQDLIKGIIINKFRGDLSLFCEGKKIIESITGKPVVGIIPYFNDIHIEQEDSVVIDRTGRKPCEGKINIAVVLLRHMSNFTDFDLLGRHPQVHLYYTDVPEDLESADIVLLPGSKNTITDRLHLRQTGLDQTIIGLHKSGKPVYGICGGYQLMGESICDPLGIESEQAEVDGLGILPVRTTITAEKKTEQCLFRFLNGTTWHRGYEIHMGTTVSANPNPVSTIQDMSVDGFFLNPETFGTYIHGFFDNPETIGYILSRVSSEVQTAFDYQTFREEQYNKLAGLIRNHVDMEFIYNTIDL